MNEKFYEAGIQFFGAGVGVLSVGVLALCLWGLLVLSALSAPRLTARCGQSLESRRLLCLLAGFGMTVVLVLLAAIASHAPVLGLVWLAVTVPVTLAGLTAASADLGRRVCYLANRDGSRFGHIGIGWGMFVLAALVPIVGWFVVLPFFLLTGLGSLVVPPKAAPAAAPVSAWTPRPPRSIE